MQDTDLQELQKDTYVIIVALVIVLSLILFYVTLIKTYVFHQANALWWIPSLLSLTSCFFSYKLYRRDRFGPGAYVLAGGLTLAVVSFLIAPSTQLSQLETYLLPLVVVLAGFLIDSKAALYTATLAVLATLGITLVLDDVAWQNFAPLVIPLTVTYLAAGLVWLSFDKLIAATHWALHSHGRAQQRSRELYEKQYELEIAYNLLEQANQSLKEAQATAVQASEFKSRFIANLSHELRTPLNAIINLSFILSRGRYGPVTPEQQDYLTRIHDAGNLLLQIVNDLLDLAKIEAGQMQIFREPVDLAAICANVITTVSGLITDDKQVELHLDIPPNLPKIYGDGMRIRQILLNLLGNAIKYTDRGNITLQIVHNSNEFVKVSVIDTGIGIKSEELQRIFEEFKQSQEAFATRKLGTGLGLPISKKFVELHGGQLWGESQYGQGAAFHFTLPIYLQTSPGLPVQPLESSLQDKVINL